MIKKSFTQDCLYTAILRLMKEKDIDDITVRQLVDKAGVSRSTFYRYYSQPIDVIQDYLRPFNQTNAYLEIQSDEKAYLRRFYKYYAGNWELIYYLIKVKKTEFLRDTITQHILDVFSSIMDKDGNTLFQQKAIVGLCVEILIIWVNNGRADKIDEMTDTVHNLVSALKRVS